MAWPLCDPSRGLRGAGEGRTTGEGAGSRGWQRAPGRSPGTQNAESPALRVPVPGSSCLATACSWARPAAGPGGAWRLQRWRPGPAGRGGKPRGCGVRGRKQTREAGGRRTRAPRALTTPSPRAGSGAAQESAPQGPPQQRWIPILIVLQEPLGGSGGGAGATHPAGSPCSLSTFCLSTPPRSPPFFLTGLCPQALAASQGRRSRPGTRVPGSRPPSEPPPPLSAGAGRREAGRLLGAQRASPGVQPLELRRLQRGRFAVAN